MNNVRTISRGEALALFPDPQAGLSRQQRRAAQREALKQQAANERHGTRVVMREALHKVQELRVPVLLLQPRPPLLQEPW